MPSLGLNAAFSLVTNLLGVRLDPYQVFNFMGKPAATVDSTADNSPAHIATPPGVSFQKPPANKATIKMGSATVNINGKQAARNGDIAETCNDPSDLPVGQVIAVGTVLIG